MCIETLAGGSDNPQTLVNLGANYAPRVTVLGEYWRLFTANFLHIGLMHLAFNLYALYIVGTEVEMFYGPARFLVIYLLTGLSGAIASYAFTYGLSAGASTAIFGLIGTLVAFFIRNRDVFGEMSRSRLIESDDRHCHQRLLWDERGHHRQLGARGRLHRRGDPRLAVVPVLSGRDAGRAAWSIALRCDPNGWACCWSPS